LLIPSVAPVATATSATTPVAGATVASATAFAAVTATATTAAAAAIVVASATTASPAPLIARTGFIHAERASVYLLAVQLAHGVLRIAIGRHRDECKSAGFPREFILHQQDFCHSASLREQVLQLDLRRRERQVAYVQSISHNGLDFCLRRSPVNGRTSLKRLH
jgi:hypothetical protein